MMKFIYETPEEDSEFTATHSITLEIKEEQDIESVLSSVKSFLQAVGYSFRPGEEIVVLDEQGYAFAQKLTLSVDVP
jgi:hypothetical protein